MSNFILMHFVQCKGLVIYTDSLINYIVCGTRGLNIIFTSSLIDIDCCSLASPDL
jgi:hypothetical protein